MAVVICLEVGGGEEGGGLRKIWSHFELVTEQSPDRSCDMFTKMIGQVLEIVRTYNRAR